MYLYRSRAKRFLVSVFDAAGRLFFKRRSGPLPPFKSLVVIRLDHLGDVILAEPFLSSLKNARPELEITFLSSPGGREILEPLFKDKVRYESFAAPWFHGKGGFFASWRGFFRLTGILKKTPADAVIDLRGDVRHILAARLAYPGAWIASYGVTGGGFLLDQELAYEPRVHAAERNLAFLAALGISKPRAVLNPGIASAELGAEIGPKKRKRIALHPGTGAPAKAWPAAHWADLFNKLESTDTELVWIGDAAAKELVSKIETESGASFALLQRVKNLAGVLPLSRLGTFFKTCDLLVSADSGPVHLAASVGLSAVVLFSGTNELHEWKPLSDHAHLLYHVVNCSPCRERVCPKPKHYCMEGITPEMAYEKIADLLKKLRIKNEK